MLLTAGVTGAPAVDSAPVAARLAGLAAVILAAGAWLAVLALIADAAGLGRPPATAEAERTLSTSDPCALAEVLPGGLDRGCDLQLRGPGHSLAVRLEEDWSGNVLTQRLWVGPDWRLITRTAPTPASRILQLRALAAGARDDHLVFTLGNCGGATCGAYDVVVLGVSEGAVTELLRLRVGRGGRFEVRDGALAVGDTQAARTYAWDGARYIFRGVEGRPLATVGPTR